MKPAPNADTAAARVAYWLEGAGDEDLIELEARELRALLAEHAADNAALVTERNEAREALAAMATELEAARSGRVVRVAEPCPCGCPTVGDLCDCVSPCPCDPDCLFCDAPADGSAS